MSFMESIDPILRQPKQKRSRETLSRILGAAETCIREEGFDSLRMAEIARRAGCSVGTLYSRLPDKMALLRAVQNKVHDCIEPPFLAEMTIERESGGSLEEAAERVFTLLCRHFLSERELFSAFMMRGVFDPGLRQGGENANLVRRQAVAAALLPHRAQIGQPDPELALDMAYTTCLAVIRGRLIWGAADEIRGPFTDEVLVGELARVLIAYLRGDAGVPAVMADAACQSVTESL